MKNIYSIGICVLLTPFLSKGQTADLIIADSLYAVGNYAEAIEHLEKEEPKEAVLLRLAKAQQARGLSMEALEN